MNDQISALMDDEIDIEEAEHLLTAVKAGGSAAESWATYHLIGDVMRGDLAMKSNMKDRVMDELAQEPVVLAPKPSAPEPSALELKHSKKPATSAVWSVAASVAAVLFVGLVVMQQQVSTTDETLAPIEIAQNMPDEYLQAHHASSPNHVSYYIQPAAYSESRK